MNTHSNKTLGLQRLCGSAFALAVVAAVVSTISQDSSGDEADKGELIQGRDGVRAILENPVKGKIELSSNTRTNLQRTIDVSMQDYSGPVDMKDRLGILLKAVEKKRLEAVEILLKSSNTVERAFSGSRYGAVEAGGLTVRYRKASDGERLSVLTAFRGEERRILEIRFDDSGAPKFVEDFENQLTLSFYSSGRIEEVSFPDKGPEGHGKVRVLYWDEGGALRRNRLVKPL